MAYVRKSKSRGKVYRQIVESYREDGKVKQRVLVHLGSRSETPEEAAEHFDERAVACHCLQTSALETLNTLPEELEEHRRRMWRKYEREGYALYKEAAEREEGPPAIVEKRRNAEKQLATATINMEKNERKAKTIRDLIASGKLKTE